MPGRRPISHCTWPEGSQCPPGSVREILLVQHPGSRCGPDVDPDVGHYSLPCPPLPSATYPHLQRARHRVKNVTTGQDLSTRLVRPSCFINEGFKVKMGRMAYPRSSSKFSLYWLSWLSRQCPMHPIESGGADNIAKWRSPWGPRITIVPIANLPSIPGPGFRPDLGLCPDI